MFGRLIILAADATARRFAAFAQRHFHPIEMFAVADWLTHPSRRADLLIAPASFLREPAHAAAFENVPVLALLDDARDLALPPDLPCHEAILPKAEAAEFVWRCNRAILLHAREHAKLAPDYDPLTGLLTLEGLLDQTGPLEASAQSQGETLGLLTIGVDQLDVVNHLYGRSVGDQMLRDIARCIMAQLGPGDCAARLEGTSFVVVGVSRKLFAAEPRWRAALEEALRAAGTDFEVNIAVEAYRTPYGRLALSDALRRIARGRPVAAEEPNSVSQSPEGPATGGIAAAIRDGEMVVRYQRQFAVSEGLVTGFEALLRWQKPGQPLLMPQAFLPAAEAEGALSDLTRFVVAQAASELRDLFAEGGVRLAINISPSQLVDRTLTNALLDLSNAAGLPIRLIDVEVPAAGSIDDIRAGLTAMAEAGLTLTLQVVTVEPAHKDWLLQLPFRRLKIDAAALVLSTARDLVRVATAQGLTCVASGIETAEAYGLALSLGFQEVQGHYFSEVETGGALIALVAA